MIRTTLKPPSAPPGAIARRPPLDTPPDAPLTVLGAPAGYGKTTLMAQWAAKSAASGQPYAWLTCDEAMADPEILLRHLSAATACGAPCEVSVETILAAIGDRPEFRIFIDDLQALSKASLCHVTRLIQLAPPNVHIVIGARCTAGLALARLRARGVLLEFGARELSFRDAETSALLRSADIAKNPQSETLAARARGWPAGLGLGLAALRDGRQNYTYAVTEFLEEEVFRHLSEADKRFLIRVSLLDGLCPPLCDALLKVKDSRLRLKRLEQAGLFLEHKEEDRSTYQIHPMFLSFLRDRLHELPAAEVRALHRRASDWLAKAGALAPALEHIVRAGDVQRAAAFIEAICEEMTYQGDIPIVARHAEALPREVLNKLPKTLMTLAWLTTRQLRFEETERLLEKAAHRIEEIDRDGEAPESSVALLRLMLKHRQTVLATAKDEEMADVDSQSEDLLRELGDTRPYLTCTLYGQMLTARYIQYRLDDFSRIEPSARSALSRSGYRFAAIGLQAALGTGLFHAGRTAAARQALEQALEEANKISGPHSGQAALAALPLARILYECDERAAADKLIEGHLPVAREFGFSEQLHSGYLTLNRLRQAEGDIDGALRALDEGKRVAMECDLTRLSIGASTERIRIWLRHGRPDLAVREGRREGLEVDADAVSPTACSIQSDEIRAMAWTRLAVGRDRTADALTVTKRWRHFCAGRGAIRTLVRWCIITAQIHGARGDLPAAKRVLHEGLSHAAEGRHLRSFIDEGPFIQKLIAEGYAGAIHTNDPIEAFARQLLMRYPESPAPVGAEEEIRAEESGAFGPLNTREVEILRLVGCGMRNGEIGMRLGLTEGTVKWYMQQIYDKVGVRRRPQAVERARQLGMLH